MLKNFKEYQKKLPLIIIAIGFSAFGYLTLRSLIAANPYVALEAESTSLATGASKGSDTNASGGQFIQFGVAAPGPAPSPTPTPGPTPTPTPTPSPTTFNPVTYDWSTVGGTPSGPLGGNNGVYIGRRTITAPGAFNTAIYGNSFTAEYNSITADEDGIDTIGNGPFLIQYNKIHRDGSTYGTAHHDGVQSWMGRNITIHRNWISGWNTSALLFKTDSGPISNVKITENYLENPTGWWIIYILDAGNGHGRPTFVDITNNKFGSHGGVIASGSTWGSQATFCHTAAQRQAAINGGNAAAAGWIVWSGNTWADGPNAGKEIAPPEPAVWL